MCVTEMNRSSAGVSMTPTPARNSVMAEAKGVDVTDVPCDDEHPPRQVGVAHNLRRPQGDIAQLHPGPAVSEQPVRQYIS
jgi:hypothetical protein